MFRTTIGVLWILGMLGALAYGGETSLAVVHHDLQVNLQPQQHTLQVQDTISWHWSGPLHFTLNADLQLKLLSDDYRLTPGSATSTAIHTINQTGRFQVRHYQLAGPPGRSSHQAVITYQGRLNYPLVQADEYERAFQETRGLIGPAGVYLAASTCWFALSKHLVTFRLKVQTPVKWHVISQGRRLARKIKAQQAQTIWDCPYPMDDIYLVGGPLTEYSRQQGQLSIMVFLRTPDKALAGKYLDATGRYIQMYNHLIGPYAYRKFALVENFWQTGYGMPSFTLLGPKIIRFPFILYSSYPHEILHNWWGNGVFVDYAQGNWCEGLTAYLADHLMKENHGAGAAYRRRVLQKYRDFVRQHQDLALKQFRARHSPVTEAVGYGKSLMLFHQLRQRIGDELFCKALRLFYQRFRFQQASFTDLRHVFEQVTGHPLERFFNEQVNRTGAPCLALTNVKRQRTSQGWQLSFTLQQRGPYSYQLQVPYAVTLQGRRPVQWGQVMLTKARQEVVLKVAAQPLRLDIDPLYDVFRKLYRAEIPASVGQIFGAGHTLLVLPAAAPAPLLAAYRRMAERWSRPGRRIVLDKDLTSLPADQAIWLFGHSNRWVPQLCRHLPAAQVRVTPDKLCLADQNFPAANHIWVLTTRHPHNPELAWGWIAADQPAAMRGLATKLPHYGKYSYLVFAGQAPDNRLKGQWPTHGSPLSYSFSTPCPPRGQLPTRSALAKVPAMISPRALMAHIKFLAAPRMQGRGLGSQELDQAADYIAGCFRQIGLQPGADKSYFQQWEIVGGPHRQKIHLRNVIGFLPGSAPQHKEVIVIGAHYDHLGLGWPDVKQGYQGQVHPGADDNASGVAVLLELARLMQQNGTTRDMLFVAFSGEEAGRLGSQYFVKHLHRPCFAMINLDTVGRLGKQPLLILGAASAREWPFIFRGCSYVTGIAVKIVPQRLDASDNISFSDQGIPAVQIFAGPHTDYHTPHDTIDKIDAPGLVRVLTIVREALGYLDTRRRPLTAKGTHGNKPAPRPHAKRRCLLGVIPDFTFPGPGVRASGIVPHSPAAAGGLQAGDIVLQIGSSRITGLRDLAKALARCRVGQRVQLLFSRQGTKHTIAVTLASR